MTLDEYICKEIENGKTKYLPLIYFKSKTQTLANDLNIYNSLNFSYQTIFSKFKNGVVKVPVGQSSWLIESILIFIFTIH